MSGSFSIGGQSTACRINLIQTSRLLVRNREGQHESMDEDTGRIVGRNRTCVLNWRNGQCTAVPP